MGIKPTGTSNTATVTQVRSQDAKGSSLNLLDTMPATRQGRLGATTQGRSGGAAQNRRKTSQGAGQEIGSHRDRPAARQQLAPTLPRVRKPAPTPGKVDINVKSYVPGARRGDAGTFPVERTITTTTGSTTVTIKGTHKELNNGGDGTTYPTTSAVASWNLIPQKAGATAPRRDQFTVGAGTAGGQSSILQAGVTAQIGRDGNFSAKTSAQTPNNGKATGVITSELGLGTVVGTTKLNVGVKLTDAQVQANSRTLYSATANFPLQQKDTAVEVGVAYENNRANPRGDIYSATASYIKGSDQRFDVELKTGAEIGTSVQGRVKLFGF
jgi:hypothetical protein